MRKRRHVVQSEGLAFLDGLTGYEWGTKGIRGHFDRCILELTGHFLSTDFEIEAATTTVIPIISMGGNTDRVRVAVTLVGVMEVG